MRHLILAMLAIMAVFVVACAEGGSGAVGNSTPGSSPGSLAIATSSLAGGTANAAYSASISATGGMAPYTWSLATGTLPPGLTLDTSSSAASTTLSGTPSMAGSYNFTVAVTSGTTAAKALTVNIAAAGSGGSFDPSAPGLIPASRRITWQAGIPGGIPTRSTIFADVTQSPYNAQADGIADDTSAIQNALNACPANQVVYMPAGTYKISQTIHLKSNVTLRGAGSATKLKWMGSANFILEIRDAAYEDAVFYNTSPYNLTGGYTKGSNTVTTSSNNWAVGDIIEIDQQADGNLVVAGGTSGPATWCGRDNGDRCMGQMVRIVTRSATSITFEPPLYTDYTANLVPQGIKVKGITQNAGFEDFAVDNANNARDSMWWFGGFRCWLKNVDMKGSYRRHLWMLHDMQCEIRGCTFHDGTGNYGPDRAYGIFLGNMLTANLIEDNIFYNLHVPIAFEGGAAGNVISANFITKVKYNDPEWAQPAIVEHGPHPMMNLIEGNVVGSKIIGDMYWGSASHNTYFRNRVYIANPSGLNYGTWLIDFYIWHKYENFVGNVLGTPGYETSYEKNCTSYAYYQGKYIFKLGYADNSGSTAGADPQIAATMIRHGNFDTVNNGVIWDSSISVQQMPPSLTYSQKPAWMGAAAWPAFGPDVASSMTNKVPAQLRYEAMGSP